MKGKKQQLILETNYQFYSQLNQVYETQNKPTSLSPSKLHQ